MADIADLAPSHLHLLALARAALDANHGPLWKKDPEEAMAHHGACCDALWDELRRQVDEQDGKVPVLEHPAVRQKALARRMRADIMATCKDAICHAIDNMVFEHD